MGKNETLKFQGLKPKPWQSVVHKAITKAGVKAGKIFVVKAKRQIGKTIIIEQELLRHAINYPNSVSICLSLTIVNCRKIYKEIIRGLEGSNIILKNNDSLLEITLITGSQILFKSAQQKENLRGNTISGGGILCIDEAAYISDDIFNIVSPWVDVNNANILMVSTPRLKAGFFYQYYMIGLAHTAPNIEAFDLCRFDTSEFLSKEKLELYRKMMPINQFTTEYLGEFVDDAGSVFQVKYINWRKLEYHLQTSEKDGYNELYVGIDWANGNGGDYTVITAFDENGVQRLLSARNDSSNTAEQISVIKDALLNKVNPHKIKKIYAEVNSMGKVYCDLLKDTLRSSGLVVEEFTTTNETKREIVEKMVAEIGEGHITLYDTEEQRREFGAYEMQFLKGNNITYNAPTGFHDDMVMAACIALHGLDKVKTKSQYSISFNNKKHKTVKLSNKYG